MTKLNTVVKGLKDSHFRQETNRLWQVVRLGRAVVVLGHAKELCHEARGDGAGGAG